MRVALSNKAELERVLNERIEFNRAGSAPALSGVQFGFSSGRLYGEALEAFYNSSNNRYYTVYSYGTPIAWFAGTRWTVVTNKFSVTTSRHQNAVIRALESTGYDKVGN